MTTRGGRCLHPEIHCKKPHFQYKLRQECGFLSLLLQRMVEREACAAARCERNGCETEGCVAWWRVQVAALDGDDEEMRRCVNLLLDLGSDSTAIPWVMFPGPYLAMVSGGGGDDDDGSDDGDDDGNEEDGGGDGGDDDHHHHHERSALVMILIESIVKRRGPCVSWRTVRLCCDASPPPGIAHTHTCSCAHRTNNELSISNNDAASCAHKPCALAIGRANNRASHLGQRHHEVQGRAAPAQVPGALLLRLSGLCREFVGSRFRRKGFGLWCWAFGVKGSKSFRGLEGVELFLGFGSSFDIVGIRENLRARK
eukprot:3203456-Rhodomonas_salina.1